MVIKVTNTNNMTKWMSMPYNRLPINNRLLTTNRIPSKNQTLINSQPLILHKINNNIKAIYKMKNKIILILMIIIIMIYNRMMV